MMSAERNTGSYVRVNRQVADTPHLAKFRQRLQDIADEFLPDRGVTVRAAARNLEEMKFHDGEPQLRAITIPAASIQPANCLKVQLFEHRSAQDQIAHGYLLRLVSHLSRLGLESLADSAPASCLPVSSSYLLESSSRLRDPNLREFSLAIDNTPSLWQLKQEQQKIHQIVADAENRSLSEVVIEDQQTMPDIIPVMVLPKWTNPRAVTAFIDRVNLENFSQPLVRLELLAPAVTAQFASP